MVGATQSINLRLLIILTLTQLLYIYILGADIDHGKWRCNSSIKRVTTFHFYFFIRVSRKTTKKQSGCKKRRIRSGSKKI